MSESDHNRVDGLLSLGRTTRTRQSRRERPQPRQSSEPRDHDRASATRSAMQAGSPTARLAVPWPIVHLAVYESLARRIIVSPRGPTNWPHAIQRLAASFHHWPVTSYSRLRAAGPRVPRCVRRRGPTRSGTRSSTTTSPRRRRSRTARRTRGVLLAIPSLPAGPNTPFTLRGHDPLESDVAQGTSELSSDTAAASDEGNAFETNEWRESVGVLRGDKGRGTGVPWGKTPPDTRLACGDRFSRSARSQALYLRSRRIVITNRGT